MYPSAVCGQISLNFVIDFCIKKKKVTKEGKVFLSLKTKKSTEQ